MISITIRYFAAARERAGKAEETVELETGANVQAVLDLVVRRNPTLRTLLPHLRVAVDQSFVEPQTVLTDGVEVALIPPVAGGNAGLSRVVARPLALDEVVREVGGVEQGGLVTFTGTVRSNTRGRTVTALEYEAYAPMADKVLAQIADDARATWPEVRVAVMHRVGRLVPGEAAVVIAASAPHRADAFAACQHTIERLKHDAPIWKKEFYVDGEVWVGLGP